MVISLGEEVREALAGRRPVVALESTVIAHGLPRPENLKVAQALEASVRAAGAVPATVGVLDGAIRVGMSGDEIARLAEAGDVVKCSTAALAPVVARRRLGATTAAATMHLAARCGIRFMATGGVGGVHRGGETSLDVSADLHELARTPTVVVCSGAKVILDLPRTLEVLETLGVTVVGWRTDDFPAFYCRGSGLPVERIDKAEELRLLLAAHLELHRGSGLLVANPPPAEHALHPDEIEGMLGPALARMRELGVRGKDETPFLLRELARATGGRSVALNQALLLANARLAAELAYHCVAESIL